MSRHERRQLRRMRRALGRDAVIYLRVPKDFEQSMRRQLAVARRARPDVYLSFDMFVRNLLMKSLARVEEVTA